MLVTNNNLHQRHELKYYVLDHNEAMSFMEAAVVKENCFVYKCYEKYSWMFFSLNRPIRSRDSVDDKSIA